MSEPTKAELKLLLYIAEGQRNIARAERDDAEAAAQATIAQLDAQVATLTTENPECLGHIPDVVAESDRGRCVRCLQPYPCEVRRMWIRWGEENRQLAARDAQVAELTAALSRAEWNTRYQEVDLDWCRICDQTAQPDLPIDHAPDCPFALLARTPAAPQDSHNP